MGETDRLTRHLILPDAHCPYHDKRALEGLILRKVLPSLDFESVTILGDFFDCYSVSTFPKNPKRLKGLKKELQVGFDLLKRIEGEAKRLIFIEGNHERRLKRFLADKAPELYEIVTDWWKERFKGWIYVPYMEDITLGKLFITHDVGRSGENSTKQSLNDYQDNVIIGHNHLLDYSVRGNAHGTAHVGASFGWLGDLDKIDYRHRMKCRRDWTLGYGIAYVRKDGVAFVSPKPIVRYTSEIEGRLYKA